MSYAFVEDVAASWEQYARVAAALAGPAPPGLIVHAAGPTEEGFRIIEVWESEDAWRRFAAASERSTDGGCAQAPRHLRELRPTHLVLAGEQPGSLTEEKRHA